MDSNLVVSTERLTKHFKYVNALTDCSFTIGKGEVVGLLGPNGSGKSTLVRLLLGFLKPTSGSANILNLDCTKQSVAVHRLVAYLPGDARMFRTMRGKDVLNFFASVRGAPFSEKANAVAKRLDLDLTRWVAFMSTGMRQKLALSVVMALDAPVTILDEPTSNLDPTVRNEVLKLVTEAQANGRTVIFSSHVLSEIEQVCDRVVILRAGRLVHTQSMGVLSQQHQISARITGKLPEVPIELARPVLVNPKISNSEDMTDFTILADGNLQQTLAWLSGCRLQNVTIQPVDLRSVYEQHHGSV